MLIDELIIDLTWRMLFHWPLSRALTASTMWNLFIKVIHVGSLEEGRGKGQQISEVPPQKAPIIGPFKTEIDGVL